MNDHLSISVPNKAEYVNVIRLTASSIASRVGFDIEEIEDIKVAVAEACTNAIKHGMKNHKENFDVEFDIECDKMMINIKDKGVGFSLEEIEEPDLINPKEGGLGIFIIKTLMDEVKISSDIGKGTCIKMIKYLGVDI